MTKKIIKEQDLIWELKGEVIIANGLTPHQLGILYIGEFGEALIAQGFITLEIILTNKPHLRSCSCVADPTKSYIY